MQKTAILFLVLITSQVAARQKASKKNGKPRPSIQLDAGLSFACALVDGQLWFWGDNLYISPDTVNFISRPRRLVHDKKIMAIACSGDDLIALDEKGTAWGWGHGDWFRYHPSGKVNVNLKQQYDSRNFPVKLFESIQWNKVDIARSRFAGLKKDSTLWIAGSDECRLLGESYYESPAQIGKGQKWLDLSLGNMHANILAGNHVLWGWGNNGYSQSGLGKMRTFQPGEDCFALQPISPAERWIAMDACTSNAIGIRENGSLWIWGDSAYNPLAPKFALEPVCIGGDAIWLHASTNERHALAVRKDGSLWAIGSNTHGELGIGTTKSSDKLVRIGNDTDWVLAKAGPLGCSMAVKTNGTIWAWGNNEHGQLGDGTRQDKYYPQLVRLHH